MSNDRDRLNILIGTWDTTITLLNPDGSEGEKSPVTDAYEWSPNGHFLYHDVDATMGGKRMQSLEIIAPREDGRYQTRSYDADGSINDFTAALDGRAWTIDGEVQRFRGTFSEDGQTLTGGWEQRGDDGGWSPLMTVVLKKRAR
jgi:hypothetical protein